MVLVLALAGPAAAAGRMAVIENLDREPATVILRGSDGALIAEVAVPGREKRFVSLASADTGIRVTVIRRRDDAMVRMLAGALALGVGRDRGEAGGSHEHNGVSCNDPNCGSGSRGGSGVDPGVLLGTVLDDEGDEVRTEGRVGEEIDGVKVVVQGEPEPQPEPQADVTPETPPCDPLHHCQGARLIIIVGNFADTAIQASLRWAEARRAEDHHLHMVAYPTGGSGHAPSWTVPHVPPPDDDYLPTSANEIWPRYRVNNRNLTLNDLVATWNDCCHFDEVLAIFHGSQVGSFGGLVANLPVMLNHRPVRQLVIWSCESSDAFYPGRGGSGGEKNYRRLAHIVRPRACPCGCQAGVCEARGPRGESDGHCPLATDTAIILASGLVNGRAAKLGLDPDDEQAPFTTPTGELRRIMVGADGAISAEIAAEGIEVFDGCRSKAEPALARHSTARVSAERLLQPARAQDPGNYPPARNPYSGPKACVNGEGCLPDE